MTNGNDGSNHWKWRTVFMERLAAHLQTLGPVYVIALVLVGSGVYYGAQWGSRFIDVQLRIMEANNSNRIAVEQAKMEMDRSTSKLWSQYVERFDDQVNAIKEIRDIMRYHADPNRSKP